AGAAAAAHEVAADFDLIVVLFERERNDGVGAGVAQLQLLFGAQAAPASEFVHVLSAKMHSGPAHERADGLEVFVSFEIDLVLLGGEAELLGRFFECDGLGHDVSPLAGARAAATKWGAPGLPTGNGR